ncbi:MAG: metallophosphoesterase [Acidobacteriota bacterium]
MMRWIPKSGSGRVLLAGLLLLALYTTTIEPNWVHVRYQKIISPPLARVLGKRVVVQLSDLHSFSMGFRERQVLKILDRLQPDLILLTGDYVPWKGDYKPALEFLSRLRAKTGVWAVMGDYDYSLSRQSCRFCHKPGTGEPTQAHSVRFLRNSVERIDLPGGSLWLGGMDPYESGVFLKRKLDQLPADQPLLILSHSPLGFDWFGFSEGVVMLSGDTHGGQIPLPAWLWKELGYEKNFRYNQGVFVKGSNTLFVSHGIGISHLPIRFSRVPEVVVLQFVEVDPEGFPYAQHSSSSHLMACHLHSGREHEVPAGLSSRETGF